MDVKKHALSDQLSPKRKVFSRLGWGLAASLIAITGLMLNSSFNGPVVGSLFQGYYGVSDATVSLHFSSSSSVSKATVDTQNTLEVDNGSSVIAKKKEFWEESEGGQVDLKDGVDIDIEGTQLENSYEGSKTGNFDVVEGRIQQIAQHANGSVVSKNGDGVILEKTRLGNFSRTLNNATLAGKNVNANIVVDNPGGANNVTNLSNNGEVVGHFVAEKKVVELNKTTNSPGGDDHPRVVKGPNGSFEKCDLFDGRWVKDDHSKPYYRPGSCPYIDKDFDCQRNGRPDKGYIKWKWQPNGCNLPRLNATDFLERLRGKRLVFIGDSLNRNMWESMDYNCSVDFVASPFLVKESSFKRENGSIETLRLDLMNPSTSMYRDADLMVFNTGHWWTHEKTSKGEDYYQEGDYVYPRLKVLNAYQKALTTWSRWVDKNVDSHRTQVFFRGYSVTHFWGGQWNSGGQCDKETEPILNETYLTKYPSKMRAVEYVIQNTKTPVIYLNISRLTDYRKDGHPSIYRREYKTEQEGNAAGRVQDCSHWCLPGVPDTWNELLYASLVKAGREI
ncbi:protein trichome birefringence-like 2 [Gossypium australe]|uniref:Protein trichome birefringence-like 2 n=1 Tax=Gossypium australe TaxID=47621 RepID=A0A5B6WQB4_9ROSI|nr:protein trichome birefringence-like 2 [Gossypium australe]